MHLTIRRDKNKKIVFLVMLTFMGVFAPACVRTAGAHTHAISAGDSAAHRCVPVCQARAAGSGVLPEDAFQRLLYRLDHAPLDLNALEPSSRRGSQISQAGTKFAAVIAPALPLLDRVAHSPTLGLLARIPVVGKPCAIAQECTAVGKELGTGFINLVELDRKHLEPLRQAIQKTTALRRSRSPEDVAPAVAALDAASEPLRAYELASVKQQQTLTALTAGLRQLDKLLAMHQKVAPKQPSTLSNTVQSLEKLNLALLMQRLTVHQLRQYTETCASDGHKALWER